MERSIDRVEMMLKAKKLKKVDFARALGADSPHFNNWRKSELPTARLMPAARYLEVYPEWLATGDGPISPDRALLGLNLKNILSTRNESLDDMIAAVNEQIEKQGLKLGLLTHSSLTRLMSAQHAEHEGYIPALAAAYDLPAELLAAEWAELSSEELATMRDKLNEGAKPVRAALPENVVAVPRYAVEPSMGWGSELLDNDELIERIELPAAWLRANLSEISSPSNLALITGKGDSMEGTFSNGDLLFVDLGQAQYNGDGCYLFVYNNELFLKRLQKLVTGGMNIISDNKALYPAEKIEQNDLDNLQIIAKVVGLGNFRTC